MKNILTFDQIFNRRSRLKRKWKNDGFRTLNESIIHKEIIQALDDWKKYNNSDCVLVGGVALSYYLVPRLTEDLDLIFMTENDIPTTVVGFKKIREHSFLHLKTHVEIEVLTPEYLNKSIKMFKTTFEESIESDGIKVANPRALIALKLNRFKSQDKTDIENLLNYCKENNMSLDMTNYDLNKNEVNNLNSLLDNMVENIVIYNDMYMLDISHKLKENNYIKVDNNTGNDIYLINDIYGEPRFYYGKNIENNIRKYEDFSFSILINGNINELTVVDSTTGYKSFNGFKKEEESLKKWLSIDDNYKHLKDKWEKINNKKIR